MISVVAFLVILYLYIRKTYTITYTEISKLSFHIVFYIFYFVNKNIQRAKCEKLDFEKYTATYNI